jgi:signal peptidase II
MSRIASIVKQFSSDNRCFVPERSAVIALTAIAALVAAVDLVTKAAVVAAFGRGESRSRLDLFHGWLALEYTENRGMAFGVVRNAGPLLTLLSIIVLIGLLVHYLRSRTPPLWETLACGVIVGGAIGNVIDRVRFGYVVDFISIGVWPNFNIADSAITIGVILLLWGWLAPRSHERAEITG